MTEKRVKIVEVMDENIGKLFRGGISVISGLPDDAELIRTWEEPHRRVFCFMFESEEFPPVEEGEEPPKEDIVVAERRVNTSSHWVCPNCTEVVENGDVIGEVEE